LKKKRGGAAIQNTGPDSVTVPAAVPRYERALAPASEPMDIASSVRWHHTK